jgi:hypothetical protein
MGEPEPGPDRNGVVTLMSHSNANANAHIIVVRINDPAHFAGPRREQLGIIFTVDMQWGPMTIPYFVFSDIFYRELREYLAMVDEEAGWLNDRYDLLIIRTSAEKMEPVKAAVIAFFENALFNRVLGMGAGAGARRYGGRRRRKTRSKSRKSKKARGKRRSVRR